LNAVERFSVQHYQIVALCDELKACVQGEDIHKNVDFTSILGKEKIDSFIFIFEDYEDYLNIRTREILK